MSGEYVRGGVSRYLMLYCDSARCRVNTFEHGEDGRCPACMAHGERIPEVTR